MRPLLPLALLPLSLAFQFPFKLPSIFKATITHSAALDSVDTDATPRIAIIGAGAAGTSAAFWLSKAKERFGLDFQVHVYEQSPHVGGRSMVVYPYDNTSLPPLELGASIFTRSNKNLWRATDEFNLTRQSFGDESYEMAIWDGEAMLLTVGNSWWDTIKLLWRYRFSPQKTRSLVDNTVKTFLTLYEQDPPRWDNISSLSDSFGWTSLVENTAADYLASQGVSDIFSQEIAEAATRVNYAQNIDEIHALEGIVSMATSDAASVQGGNYKIFEEFIKRSDAKLLLNATVTSISPKSDSSYHWTVRSAHGSADYQAIVLAAPFHSTGILLPNSISSQIPPQPYVSLHVTLLTTTSPTPDPTYFALPSNANTSRMILTTYEGARKGGKAPEFNSLSYLGLVREGEWAVKIFSKEPVTDDWLQNLFHGNVGWVYRKQWHAYPLLPPVTAFPPTRLDRGLFYVNAFEPFISTMETETIASRNVVDLLLNEEFQTSICGARISAAADNVTTLGPEMLSNRQQDFTYGWDC
ncbi:hypothetical protein AX17_000725 [Amanita inopinata Kibby_2008]|nr:hypothetical protein AX17_000725 [Amanita inopinata Kibby_2008]